MTTAQQAIIDRAPVYGGFADRADISQNLKRQMQAARGWANLAGDQRESLEMIASKISRILNGDPDYDDSWVDIAGYAQLVVDRLRQPKAPPVVPVQPKLTDAQLKKGLLDVMAVKPLESDPFARPFVKAPSYLGREEGRDAVAQPRSLEDGRDQHNAKYEHAARERNSP